MGADCNTLDCGNFHKSSMAPRLHSLLSSRPWDFVLTHNPNGEYGHQQHQGIHYLVKDLLLARNSASHTTRLLVFCPWPEVNASLSPGKRRMLGAYMSVGHISPA